jgi:hypothetical protein
VDAGEGAAFGGSGRRAGARTPRKRVGTRTLGRRALRVGAADTEEGHKRRGGARTPGRALRVGAADAEEGRERRGRGLSRAGTWPGLHARVGAACPRSGRARAGAAPSSGLRSRVWVTPALLPRLAGRARVGTRARVSP